MIKSAEHILEEAMALEPADRMELIDRLSETLEPSTDLEYTRAWEQEIRQRIQQVKDGQTKPIPWRQAVDEIVTGEGNAD